MSVRDLAVPHLTMAYRGPLYEIEKIFLNNLSTIESWFREQWLTTPPVITSSVDLRHAGFKLAPVDTNLFPAGFNNLNRAFLPLCIQAIQTTISDINPSCVKILLVPENHTRNQFYFKSLSTLREILLKAGFIVRIGSLDPNLEKPQLLNLENEELLLEPILRQENRVRLKDYDPCLILLNNDLSSGIPKLLQEVEQIICPAAQLGWSNRLKSTHFYFFESVATEFAALMKIDPWQINPYFTAVEGVNFIAQEGVEHLAAEVDRLLLKIADKYANYGIKERPFVVVKADSGTYGMSVMMGYEGKEFMQLNRKQRTRMASSKGNRKVDRVLIQEGVYTFESMADGAVAEPVVYMIGQFVVGGFYRVHQDRGINENLNAPGMHFVPLAFEEACNTPGKNLKTSDNPNRFYVYGVVARLAALAAAREMAALSCQDPALSDVLPTTCRAE